MKKTPLTKLEHHDCPIVTSEALDCQAANLHHHLAEIEISEARRACQPTIATHNIGDVAEGMNPPTSGPSHIEWPNIANQGFPAKEKTSQSAAYSMNRTTIAYIYIEDMKLYSQLNGALVRRSNDNKSMAKKRLLVRMGLQFLHVLRPVGEIVKRFTLGLLHRGTCQFQVKP